VYKPTNKIANAIKQAVATAPKVLIHAPRRRGRVRRVEGTPPATSNEELPAELAEDMEAVDELADEWIDDGAFHAPLAARVSVSTTSTRSSYMSIKSSIVDILR
jgi:hypothetical protein